MFRLPGKKALLKLKSEVLGKIVVMDEGESPVERPKKAAVLLLRQKEKAYPEDSVNHHPPRKDHLCSIGKGRTHDFRLFKESNIRLHPAIALKAHSGYQSIEKMHRGSEVPHKRSKKRPLTPEQKAYNRSISPQRVLVEPVIGKLKVFCILSERYRNRRKRFGLRVNLIADIVNYELAV
ncbi:MAG: transposase [Flavisolibacter sp.]|nr:transposase [Flavisolibacter sp.]